MSSAGVGSKSSSFSLQSAYITQFRNHALSLLWLGYQRLNPSDFVNAEEDEITGELKREIVNVLEDSSSPKWVEHYFVPEQVRVNVKRRRGKDRPIIDIEIERSRRGKRPRLPFEAKRLGRGSNVGDYLGDDGLRAFLDGTYPTTHCEAGMLGYIQEDTEYNWAAKLSKRLSKTPRPYKVTSNGQWTIYKCSQPPSNTYQSIHNNKTRNQIKVIHLLLLFH
jgi:hypothetical protein